MEKRWSFICSRMKERRVNVCALRRPHCGCNTSSFNSFYTCSLSIPLSFAKNPIHLTRLLPSSSLLSSIALRSQHLSHRQFFGFCRRFEYEKLVQFTEIAIFIASFSDDLDFCVFVSISRNLFLHTLNGIFGWHFNDFSKFATFLSALHFPHLPLDV